MRGEEGVEIDDCSSVFEEEPIPGLLMFNEFISKEEEEELVKHIDRQKWLHLNNRKVQHYGF